MAMRRITTTETDPADNRRTRVKHRYVEMDAGQKVASVGIGGGPGSRAAERGLVAPRDGAAGDQASGEGVAIGGLPEVERVNGDYLIKAPDANRRLAEMLEQERRATEERIEREVAAARAEERELARQVRDRERGQAATVAKGLSQREAELMAKIDKLERDVAQLQQRAEETEGEVLRLRDNLAQISADHGQAIDRLENALGMLGEAAAKAANSTKD